MFVLAGFALIVPVLLLAAVVVGLVHRGPLGVLAAVALLVAVSWATRTAWRRGRRWWKSY